MKENVLDPVELTANQRRIFVDLSQLYEAYQDAFRKNESFTGSMRWRTSKGREYLFKQLDRSGNGKSLGPRSEETEEILDDFRGGRGHWSPGHSQESGSIVLSDGEGQLPRGQPQYELTPSDLKMFPKDVVELLECAQ